MPITTAEVERDLGMLPGINARSWFAWTADERDDFIPGPPRAPKIDADGNEVDDPDFWIEETPKGIRMRRDPEAALRDRPHLAPVVMLFLGTPDLLLDRAAYDELPAFAMSALRTMRAAHAREELRRARDRTPEADGDG